MRISDGSSDVCSSDLRLHGPARALRDRGAVAVSRAGFIFDRNEARIDEALERRAFPELDREPEPAPAAMRAAWNWLDTLYAIDAAEAILRRGYIALADYPRLAVLRGRTPDQARADAKANYEQACAAALAAERRAA